MLPLTERWKQWGRWYAVIAAFGLLAGAVWALWARPPSHTESQVPVPGPTETRHVQVPLLPGVEPTPSGPVKLLMPQPTQTVTERPKTEKKKHESGPDGRKEVVPSDNGGTTTGGSDSGGADGESVAPTEPTM